MNKQRFTFGDRVFINEDRSFYGKRNGTVVASYAEQYGGDNNESYTVNIDGHGTVSWFDGKYFIRLLDNTPLDRKAFRREGAYLSAYDKGFRDGMEAAKR
jgi:hypothetical protein